MSSQVIGGPGQLRTYRTSFVSSGTFVVPTGVTLLNVRCIGGGGGGGGCGGPGGGAHSGGSGVTTTFSSVSAAGGAGGANATVGVQDPRAGTSGTANTGSPGTGAGMSPSGQGHHLGADGSPGADIRGFLAVTPGASISYTIGGGGVAGPGTVAGYVAGISGGAGGSGRIDLEWQV